MDPDLRIALQVTIVGMVLVFLTLIICALVIGGLNRIFKAKPEEGQDTSVELPIATFPEQSHIMSQPASQASGEAAAVAVAIALAMHAANQARNVPAGRLPAAPERGQAAPSAEGGPELASEPVTVIHIDSGPSIWSGAGRIQAAR